MIYGRAYISGETVVALQTSNQPIDMVVMEGYLMYDLTLSSETFYNQISFDGITITGDSVITCEVFK